MPLPTTIRIEVKFSTGDSVPLPVRELAALAVSSNRELGLIATLFWCGDRRVDGRWLIADAADTVGPTVAQSMSISTKHMERAMRGQPWLVELKEHIERYWPPFLDAFHEVAMRGHEPLWEELQRCHEEGTVARRLAKDRILESDHRDGIREIIEHHGEHVSGHVFQDLFAYLVGHVGYATVTLNPVGVPDAIVTDLRGVDHAADEIDLGSFQRVDVERLVLHCRRAGDVDLAARLELLLGEPL